MTEEKVNTQAQNGGRTPKFIDWEKVDRLLEAGCSGVEIAPHFGVHYETLYDRAVKEKGVMWTVYSQEKKAKGNSNLRVKQYQQAMKGDRGMLIWLGKQRLEQRDQKDSRFELEGNPTINVMNFGDKPNPQPFQAKKEEGAE